MYLGLDFEKLANVWAIISVNDAECYYLYKAHESYKTQFSSLVLYSLIKVAALHFLSTVANTHNT